MKFNVPKQVKSVANRVGAIGKRGWGAVAAIPVSMVAAQSAFAQDDLGAQALAAINGLDSSVKAVLAVLVGVVFLLVLFSYLKKAK